ncbi:hypothetical protein GALL_372890 [mine drainage metagenome]|uniref:Uncharacterized protein n=1 Tax=mine drainage metagenome TaxID=410659 RepID=A0A1J5QLV6_9ZZZZ
MSTNHSILRGIFNLPGFFRSLIADVAWLARADLPGTVQVPARSNYLHEADYLSNRARIVREHHLAVLHEALAKQEIRETLPRRFAVAALACTIFLLPFLMLESFVQLSVFAADPSLRSTSSWEDLAIVAWLLVLGLTGRPIRAARAYQRMPAAPLTITDTVRGQTSLIRRPDGYPVLPLSSLVTPSSRWLLLSDQDIHDLYEEVCRVRFWWRVQAVVLLAGVLAHLYYVFDYLPNSVFHLALP